MLSSKHPKITNIYISTCFSIEKKWSKVIAQFTQFQRVVQKLVAKFHIIFPTMLMSTFDMRFKWFEIWYGRMITVPGITAKQSLTLGTISLGNVWLLNLQFQITKVLHSQRMAQKAKIQIGHPHSNLKTCMGTWQRTPEPRAEKWSEINNNNRLWWLIEQ